MILYNLSYTNPRILKDNEICPSDICTKESYTSDGNLTFSVTSFSVYSTEETPTVTTPGSEDHTTYRGINTIKSDTYWLYKEGILQFTFDNKVHSIKLTYIGSNYADLEIFSESIKVRINLGEFKLIDLDKDGIDDIKIILNNIQSSKVSLSIDYLNNKIKQKDIGNISKPKEIQEEKEQLAQIKEKSRKELFIILGIIAVLFVFYFESFKNKKRKKKFKINI